jgi:hypothetical protein
MPHPPHHHHHHHHHHNNIPLQRFSNVTCSIPGYIKVNITTFDM